MLAKAAFFMLAASILATFQASPAVAQAAAQGAALPYRINPGDELEVFVWGEERLQRVVRVLPDGTFSFPLVGRVVALNRLPTEIESVISEGLKPQYSGAVPQVTVSVRNPAGLQFSVIGKVRNPGTFTPGRYVNALEALSLAGGPTEFAQVGGIVIIRKEGTGLTSLRVRLSDALRGSPSQNDLSPNGIPQIRGGDTVIVP
jgi:polysaccharide biosynthesis/export protein